jgi:hypothetical protein
MTAPDRHAPDQPPPPPKHWPAWAFYLLPFAAALVLIDVYGVNVPYADEWWLPGLFTAIVHRQGIIQDLLRCNNVHPVFFPKLIWLAVAFPTRWNLRAEMVATLFTILALLVLCSLLAKREEGGGFSWQIAGSTFVTSLLLFSFVHYDTLLWSFELSFTLVNLAVVAAIYLLCTSLEHPLRGLILAWLCCIVASFSSLQGMLSWLVILPCLAIPFRTKRAWSQVALGSILLGCVCLAIYFFVFARDIPLSDGASWRSHPGQTLAFLLAVVGAPLAEGAFGAAGAVAWPIGAVILVLFVAAGSRAVTLKSSWEVAIPWICIGLFGLGFSAMTAVARSSEGIYADVTYGSRFFSSSVLVTVTVVHLMRQAAQDRKWRTGVFPALAVLIGIGAVAGSAASIPIVRQNKQNRLRAAACLEVMRYIDPSTDDNVESCLFAIAVPVTEWVHTLRTPAQQLGDLGWRKIAVDVAFIEKPAIGYGHLDPPQGGEEPAVVHSADWIYLTGWAAVPNENRLPKFVLFAVDDAKQFIHAARLGDPSRPDVASYLHVPLLVESGWQVLLPAKLLPMGASRITAWAYDDQRNQFVRLDGVRLVTKY